MALNNKIKKKIEEKTLSDSIAKDAITQMLKAVDDGRQLKRVIDPILKLYSHAY